MNISPSELKLEAIPSPAAASAASPARRMRSGILAVIDSSAGAINAAWRAALVARDHGRPLHLAAIQPHAAGALAAKPVLQDVAGQLQERLEVSVQTSAVAGDLRDCVVALAADKELVVVPWQAAVSWSDRVLGALPQRMLRWVAAPVLIVQGPANASYRRVLAPVKLGAGAELQVAMARRMARGQALRVLHVLEPGPEGSLRLAGVSQQTLSIHRQRRAQRAYAQLDALIERTGAGAEGAAPLIASGHVSRRVMDAARGHDAQLIVTGAAGGSVLGDVLCGGVVQDLLREAQADLLVVPSPQSWRPSASHDASGKE